MEAATEQTAPAMLEPEPLRRRMKRSTVALRLWQRRALLIRSMLLGFVVFAGIAFVIPAKYRSTTQLMPPESPSTPGLALLSAATEGTGLGAYAGSLLGMKSSSDLFIGILQSRSVQDRLINSFDLRKSYNVKLYENARKQLTRNTEISVDRKSGIITVSVIDKDPQRAALIARQYVDELDRLVTQLTTSSAHRERTFLEERLAVVKKELDESARQLSEFASKKGAIDLKEQGKAMLGSAATLQGQLIAAQSELKGLQEIYTANDIRIKTVQARIAELRRQLEKLGGQEAGAGEAATGSQDALSLYPSIRRLPLLGVTYEDLYRRQKINEAVFETLTKQYELARVQEAKEIPTVRVLDAADVPEKKFSPPRLVISVLGMLLSLLAAIAWVVAGERWTELAATHPLRVFADNATRERRRVS